MPDNAHTLSQDGRTVRRKNLKKTFLPWKQFKCFLSTLRRKDFKTWQSPVILDFCLKKTLSGKSNDYRDDDSFRKSQVFKWFLSTLKPSPTMLQHIRDSYVISARKFKLNNDLSCPDNTKNERHLQTVCMFCAITSLLVKFHKSWHMAFEDDTSAANTRRPFSEILPRLEPVANVISSWFIARNFWYESKLRSKISF